MAERGKMPGRQGLYDPKFEHDSCGIGMLVNIKGEKSRGVVTDAIDVLKNLTHRGGAGSEPETGDGAGILIQIPHGFFARAAAGDGFSLPEEGGYGVAMIFASPERERCRRTIERFCDVVRAEGLEVLGLRRVPVNSGVLGRTAAEVCPGIRQVFIARPGDMAPERFERALYAVSQISHREIRCAERGADRYFYIASISARTIVYKGMLRPSQLAGFYLDLMDEDVRTAIALVHSRFSTNTFPSWERAHPMRQIIHNGEINTIRGNVNWVKARQSTLKSDMFGADLQRLFPVINEDGSDSAMLDDFLRLLTHAGYSLPEAVMLAIPQPWENDDGMDGARRAMYSYNSCMAEPWDGPAAIAFTDGVMAGATLDRNGLRPSRYVVTKSGLLVLASETGVLDLPESEIVTKQRLRPGRLLLVDTAQGRIIEDGEFKAGVAASRPYGRWLEENLKELGALPEAEGYGVAFCDIISGKAEAAESLEPARQAVLKSLGGARQLMVSQGAQEPGVLALPARQKLFGYTWEDLTLTLKAMAETGDDPVSSMGIDTPLAVLSGRPQLLYNYFKQLFAQVTNPPIDAIREKIVTSALIQLGREGNLLEPGPENCRMIRHDSPILTDAELQKLRGLSEGRFRSITLPILFCADREDGLKKALDQLFLAADAALESGYDILILSDRCAGEGLVPIPALLAVAGLHHHLVRKGMRTRASLVAETGEARETHHMALLVGYGANAVNPYLAYRTISAMAAEGRLGVGAGEAQENYSRALTKTIIKIMSKMGISTVRSYHGAQIFEALGIGQAVVDRYFTGTTTRIGGLGLEEIEREALARYADAFDPVSAGEPLDAGGDYKWRKNGEYHLFNPENIFYLQQACRTGDYELYKTFAACVNKRSEQVKNIRGLLSVVVADKPIPIDTVEPAESIVRRFKTGAMSYGSISREAHECMAIAMNRLGGKSNTGEGGEEAERFVAGPDGLNRNSAIKQVASGRFGVTIHYLNNAREIQIKMAQGAKPGEGGHLPGRKVYPWVAKSRHSTPGVELISPPPHHDIYSIEDLAELIHDLKCANPEARISVKLVSEAGVGTVAVGVAKGLADVIVISGYDGGTGAAPRTSIRHAGLPWELGVAEAHQTLLLNSLRERVVLETDGKLLTGRDIVIAALLGAEEFAFATAPLVAMGCNMMRVCNLDTCPVGIATQNPQLRKRFCGKPEHVENLMMFLAQDVREWMARMGVRRFTDLIGHAELLRQKKIEYNYKADKVDLSGLLYQPKVVDSEGKRHFSRPQDHGMDRTPDARVLIPLCRGAVGGGGTVDCRLRIRNTDRTVGCSLSGRVVREHGPGGLPDGAIRLHLSGSAGQSFGAFLAPGITLDLSGDANDYLGKGLSGGRIIVRAPENAGYSAEKNVIAGNVAFFGATSGEGYIGGLAGERFCVRNSGARVVAEGIGDHGCEYMTGGVAVVLGAVGRNFAAGMSGGVAYVYNPEGGLAGRCGGAKVALERLAEPDRAMLRAMLERHLEYTGSPLARRLLDGFESEAESFIKVIPHDYSRALAAMERAGERNLTLEDQLQSAFDAVVEAN
jgi:glutamate synthase (ferredoxin)